jgi:hypothetical protein
MMMPHGYTIKCLRHHVFTVHEKLVLQNSILFNIYGLPKLADLAVGVCVVSVQRPVALLHHGNMKQQGTKGEVVQLLSAATEQLTPIGLNA